MAQIKKIEAARDAVVKKPSTEDAAERMIRDLVRLCGIGVEGATLLVREPSAATSTIGARLEPMPG